MDSLKVSFTLGKPIAIPSHPIHLDSLLAWANVHREQAKGNWDENFKSKDDLPLECVTHDSGDFFWKASQLLYRHDSYPFTEYMTRQMELEEWMYDRKIGRWGGKSRNKFDQGTGIYKRYYFQDFYIKVANVHAYCVGDSDAVHESLKHIHGIGRQMRNGWGKVKSFSVGKIDADACKWNRRTIPAWGYEHTTDQHAKVSAVTRPPYWKRKNLCMAYALKHKTN